MCQIGEQELVQEYFKARNNEMKPIWQNGYDSMIMIFLISMSVFSINGK